MRTLIPVLAITISALDGACAGSTSGSLAGTPSVAGHASIQEAIDRNPGCQIYVPAGDHEISAPIRITSDFSGLWGPGRIVQTDPGSVIIEARGVKGVQLRNITITRASGRQESGRSAIQLERCENAVIDGVRVIDNWANASAISISESNRAQVRNCLVQNYSRIAVDDRTGTAFLGYAFTCIDGTGITVRQSVGALIAHNRIVELRMRPTPELKEKFKLGKFVKKNAVKGWHPTQEMWDSEYFDGWHQGSAIVVNSGERSDFATVIGNYIENAAQGIDIHSDHTTVAYNLVVNSFIGMKAIHGSRNTLILGNQFARNDLWAINLAPGTASHEAGKTVELSGGRKSGAGENVDGYSVVANNIVSDFGYGDAHWNWSIDFDGGIAPIRFGRAGFAARGHPPLRDVIVQGNILQDAGRDGFLVDGEVKIEPPRYRLAVKIATGVDAPHGLVLVDNLIHPGTGDAEYVSGAGPESNVPSTPSNTQ